MVYDNPQYVCIYLVGGLEHFLFFPLILGISNHPNRRTPIFQRGGPTTNQICLYLSLYRYLISISISIAIAMAVSISVSISIYLYLF